MKLILTCEHGGNKIPKKYEGLFQNGAQALASHRGYDPGALDLFMELKQVASFSHYNEVSRLLVELNRSLHHPQLFSEFTCGLPKEEKRTILEAYYFPYRKKVEEAILNELKEQKNARILHLSLHSFTPVLDGAVRDGDIGLLFDPGRKGEKNFSQRFKELLFEGNPSLKIRFNYPYLGKSDGFTTYLRRKFPENYLGIEVEINQKFALDNRMDSEIKDLFFNSLIELSWYQGF